jgi:hypothetical protein
MLRPSQVITLIVFSTRSVRVGLAVPEREALVEANFEEINSIFRNEAATPRGEHCFSY